MLRALVIVALLLIGCGKKADPAYEAKAPAVSCKPYKILRAEEGTTLMEEVVPMGEIPGRIQRNGIFGAAGDQFKYCE